MNRNLQDIMTRTVQAVRHDTTLREVASMMRDSEIGDVLVALDFMSEAGDILDDVIEDRQRVKRHKVSDYLHHQSEPSTYYAVR